MMHFIILCGLFTVALAAPKDNLYTSGNEHFDMDALIADHKMIQTFLDCFLDKAPCTELTESYKKIIPKSLKDACSRCTDNQKYMYWRFLQAIKKIYPEQYLEFRHHYDPENAYFESLEQEISKFLTPMYD